MEQANWWILPVAALIPLIVGFVWYNPKVFGNAWLNEAEISEERAQSGNMIKIFGFSYLFSLLGAFILSSLVVHQSGLAQLFVMDPAINETGSEINQFVSDFMNTYGDRHRSFGHGVIHGLEAGLAFGLMLIGVNSLFERKSMKYRLINVGFWMVCMALMGGVICMYF